MRNLTLLYIFAHNSKLILLQRDSLAGVGSQLDKGLGKKDDNLDKKDWDGHSQKVQPGPQNHQRT